MGGEWPAGLAEMPRGPNASAKSRRWETSELMRSEFKQRSVIMVLETQHRVFMRDNMDTQASPHTHTFDGLRREERSSVLTFTSEGWGQEEEEQRPR